MSLKIRSLSKQLQEKAENEINEVPTQIEEILRCLKNWLSKQEHIIYKDDDQLLVNFLRGSKYSLERVKVKLDGYYTFKTIAPEIALNLDPFQSNIQAYLKLGMCVPLSTPKNDPASPRVLLVRYPPYDPEEITVITILKAVLIVANILFYEDDNFVISGAKVLWDLKGVHYKTALQATPNIIKKTIYCFGKAYPARIKEIYVINIPTYFESILKILKLLFSKKLGSRVHLYSTNNLEQVYNDIPKSILPTEYGGYAGLHSDLAANWKKTVENHCEMLKSVQNFYIDESKRPQSSNVGANLFGIDGSFKQLEID